ncbi:MAG: ribosome biogenesis GTP-binding protein YihA/YsxC [Bacteroidota bacterium]|nr:YihA family ribosome biogenesis GTP-binding protein [Flavobacteriales bacterium]MEC8546873.1 ribosome biogenesis GTP-binding protein YihA/YsxC [Bacteroidota bacterium]MEE2723426.1 ribosome biogenesis GTP-binding protein YihA/YsxC [Bacteroidota bacterium]|tara:strand:+ start:685 stop:1290 length:606 start_codon:yes stop_codon:yes gene_type:complete
MNVANAEFVVSNTNVEQCPKTKLPEYAFIGRSNVGKSSLINMLCNKKKLAKTSSRPGKTQLINHFLINKQWYLVDLPGYGYARTSKAQKKTFQKFITDYLIKRKELISTFLLIDLRHKPQPLDLKYMRWLGKNLIPFSIIFTKADKLKEVEINEYILKYLNDIRKDWEEIPQHFITSSEKKIGKSELLNYIDEINKSISFI